MDSGVYRPWSDFGAQRSKTRQDAKTRHEESVLCMVDAFAWKACGRAYPIEFGLAEREVDRQAVSRLCEAIMLDKGRARSRDLGASLAGELDDPRAVVLAGWDADRVVAASRLVLPRAGHQLPTEAAFELCVEPKGHVVDAGWFIVAREVSSFEHRILAGLIARSWLEVRARGFNHVCAALSRGALRVSQRIGLKVIPLAPARRWLGEERYPVALDLVGAAPHLFDRWATTTSDG